MKVETDGLRLQGRDGERLRLLGAGLGLRVGVEAVVDLGLALGEEGDLAVGLCDGPDCARWNDLGK